MIYFDHNATAPLLSDAGQTWLEASHTFIGNPSSPHRLGGRAEAALNRARETLARLLGCAPLDIVWTSGATESNNTVLAHCAQTLPSHAHVWLSAIEHPCVLQAARHYFPKRNVLIPVRKSGVLDLDWLRQALADRRPGLVAVMAANNETGILQPWREVLALCREHEVPCFCDAVQWLGKLPAAGLGDCDYLTGSAHKFGGPKGVGFLKCPVQPPTRALLLGGPQEEGRRAGTENLPGVLSMIAALEMREKQLRDGQDQSRLSWRQQFEKALLEHLPGSQLVGGRAERLWNTVSVIMPDTAHPLRWVVKLDKAGYAVSTGSACSSGKEKPSHVLAAMGFSAEEAGRVLRFSSGWETSDQDWQGLLEALTRTFSLVG